MTVVAWDGKTLAADRQMTHPSGQVMPLNKVRRLGSGGLVGFSGDPRFHEIFVAWIEGSGRPETFRKYFLEHYPEPDFEALYIHQDGSILAYLNTALPYKVNTQHHAIGSGGLVALAAMHLGNTAVQAVQVACELLPASCGLGIDCLDLNRDNKG